MSDLMILLGSGGFFRDNGLNSLPSIKYIGSLLNDPNIFKELDVKIETVVSFVRKSKYIEQKSFTLSLSRYQSTRKSSSRPNSCGRTVVKSRNTTTCSCTERSKAIGINRMLYYSNSFIGEFYTLTSILCPTVNPKTRYTKMTTIMNTSNLKIHGARKTFPIWKFTLTVAGKKTEI